MEDTKKLSITENQHSSDNNQLTESKSGSVPAQSTERIKYSENFDIKNQLKQREVSATKR